MKKYIIPLLLILITLCQRVNAEPGIYVENLLDAIALSETIHKDVLVIFTADWCVFCKNMEKDIIETPSIVNDKIVCYINMDNNPELVKEYRVKTIPDYFILRNKIELTRKVGYSNKNDLVKWLKNNE
jgi:thiol:disulfide interchange protein